MYRPNLSVVCFFICLSYLIFYCALLVFCAQAWHGKTLSSRINPIFFCSLHWRNLSLYNKITTTHFKQIRFWWKNVITFRGKVYSNFFKFVQQLFFLSAEQELPPQDKEVQHIRSQLKTSIIQPQTVHWLRPRDTLTDIQRYTDWWLIKIKITEKYGTNEWNTMNTSVMIMWLNDTWKGWEHL